jgi:hypothetical protein
MKNSLLKNIEIDFDSKRGSFFISILIYYSETGLPSSVDRYVEVRQNHFFNPYKTFFRKVDSWRVDLVQELPFRFGFQPSFREQLYSFQKLASGCHQILLELALEEKMELIEAHLMCYKPEF